MKFERIADIKRCDFIRSAIVANCKCGSSVLDFGCGNGIISMELGRAGFQVTGVDVSEKTIATARSHNSFENVRFEVCDHAKHFSQNYDAIVCSEVLEHLAEPAELLRQLHRVLEAAGILVVTVPNGRGPRELLVTKPVQNLRQKNGAAWRMLSNVKSKMGYTGVTAQSDAEDLRHLQFFTRASLAKLAAATGFTIESTSPSNFIEQVFPFSLLTKNSLALQRADCFLADHLPLSFTSGFMSVWKKK